MVNHHVSSCTSLTNTPPTTCSFPYFSTLTQNPVTSVHPPTPNPQVHCTFSTRPESDNPNARSHLCSHTQMKRLNRNPNNGTYGSLKPSDVDEQSVMMRDSDKNCGFFNPLRLMGVLLVGFMLFSVFFSVSVVLKDPPTDGVLEATVFQMKSEQQIVTGSDDTGSWEEPNDKLLGGLLAASTDENSCISKYESALYHKKLKHRPASYLISRLRTYEALNKRCGPQTEPYNQAVEKLRTGDTSGNSDCNYVVWISFSGLGNRILTLASAFLYALLTNRVLIVDPGTDMTDLFCNPFPEAPWFLPSDFPLKDQFNAFHQGSPHCYGKMVKGGSFTSLNQSKIPSFVYLHLVHDYNDQDKLFFCEEDQTLLQKVPWLILKTDNYFVPSLFLIPSFEQELNNLFPEKETVFHFLGRYLFHPTNAVWGLIKRYYLAYLAKANKKVGIQIRVFDTDTGPFQYVLDQILACIAQENLLPELHKEDTIQVSSGNKNSIAVLMTSLSSGYFQKIRNIYWEHPTITGEIVSIFQPSHEEYQQTEKQMHNRKAWAEMYLLSMTDTLVTSSWSTFGYVAQGLGGLKPWILYKPENRTAPDPPCQRAMSMEPCFHAPPFYDCKTKRGIDTGAIVPHLRHCEDMSWGLKLLDVKDDL